MSDGNQDQELEHILQMLGDIERNLAFNVDAEERIADHLTRFWAPSMRIRLLDYAASPASVLGDLSRRAVGRLERP